MRPFTPPFCPSPSCNHHVPGAAPYSAFIAWGSYSTRAFGEVPRFRCTLCGKTFSRQTFHPDFYAKKALSYEDIARRISSCESLSAIGRAHRASTDDTISNRISRASRKALAFESEQAATRCTAEDLAADGLESFCRSQFYPNNITILAGSASQFV